MGVRLAQLGVHVTLLDASLAMLAIAETEIMLDGSRKARAALRNTEHGSSTYSRR
jgi:hypothetical protein